MMETDEAPRNPMSWGKLYADAGLACCRVDFKTESGKKPQGKDWGKLENTARTAGDIARMIRRHGAIGCVHEHSGTWALDLDLPLHLILLATSAAGLDLAAALAAHHADPMTQGNPERPPKLWLRVPDHLRGQIAIWSVDWKDFPTAKEPQGEDVKLLECRGGPGQIMDVLPPTPHKVGGAYRWLNLEWGEPLRLPTRWHPELLRLALGRDTFRDALRAANPYGPTPPNADEFTKARQGLELLAGIAPWDTHAKAGLPLLRQVFEDVQARRETHPAAVALTARSPSAPAARAPIAATRAVAGGSPPDAQAMGAVLGGDLLSRSLAALTIDPAEDLPEDWDAARWCAVWCEHVSPQELLEQYGYKRDRTFKASGDVLARYLAPGSTTGEPGTRVLRGTDGRLRVLSAHGDRIPEEKPSWDAWELLKQFECGGDAGQAIRAAREGLTGRGIEVPRALRPGERRDTGTGLALKSARTDATPSVQEPSSALLPINAATRPQLVRDDLREPGDRDDLREPGDRDGSEDGLALALGDHWENSDQPMRWTETLGCWHYWDEWIWRRDDVGHVGRSALELLRIEAKNQRAKHQADTVKAIAAIEANVRGGRKLQAVLGLAKLQRRHATARSDWDARPMLLATPGGTVDLETGRLRRAAPGDMLTQCAAVAPAPEGTQPRLWLDTLHYLMGGEEDPDRAMSLVSYWQRLCGYALTGLVEEHHITFGHGSGRNGKSLIVQTLLHILGDYATVLPSSVLMDSRNDQHPTELARLQGKRLAIASETERGKRWAEAKLKGLTGGDRIVARYMRQDFFEFEPSHKLLVVGNARPDLRHIDEAMRRRLHMVPFNVTVPIEKVDPDLGRKLQAEAPAILRWMIDGCKLWQRDRLSPPAAVLEATAEYFESVDTLGEWLADRCDLGPQLVEGSSALWQDWEKWATAAGEAPRSQRWLIQQLQERGFHSVRSKALRRVLGVQLR